MKVRRERERERERFVPGRIMGTVESYVLTLDKQKEVCACNSLFHRMFTFHAPTVAHNKNAARTLIKNRTYIVILLS